MLTRKFSDKQTYLESWLLIICRRGSRKPLITIIVSSGLYQKLMFSHNACRIQNSTAIIFIINHIFRMIFIFVPLTLFYNNYFKIRKCPAIVCTSLVSDAYWQFSIPMHRRYRTTDIGSKIENSFYFVSTKTAYVILEVFTLDDAM